MLYFVLPTVSVVMETASLRYWNPMYRQRNRTCEHGASLYKQFPSVKASYTCILSTHFKLLWDEYWYYINIGCSVDIHL